MEPSVVSIARIKPPPPSVLRRNERFGPFGPGLERGRREAERNVQENPEHPEYVPNDFGVGILIATGSLNERFVLTNYHVVRGGPIAGDGSLVSNEKLKSDSVLTLKFSDRRSCPASIIAADPRSDLAV
ncbi:MAG: hypothetical protein FJ267_14555, partial [Planctomycetes bacterium]|nr:hypothetical protein [Planctomycetota bacterium]